VIQEKLVRHFAPQSQFQNRLTEAYEREIMRALGDVRGREMYLDIAAAEDLCFAIGHMIA